MLCELREPNVNLRTIELLYDQTEIIKSCEPKLIINLPELKNKPEMRGKW